MQHAPPSHGSFPRRTNPTSNIIPKPIHAPYPSLQTIIFSEYPDCLRAIKKLLPDIGLQSRDLIGSGSAGARSSLVC